MTVREATPLDISILVDFQLKMALETENLALDVNLLTPGVQNLFKDPALGKYFVAEEHEEVTGCLMTTFEWSDWRNGTILWIQSVYISERHRGKGVYTKMYSYIQELVKNDATLKGIRLYVDSDNTSAQQVYQKLGMNGDHYRVYEWMKSEMVIGGR